MRSGRGKLAALGVIAGLTACAQLEPRNPPPESVAVAAQPLGLTGLRHWGDDLSDAERESLALVLEGDLRKRLADREAADETPALTYLALSGGGQWGAFAAGVLKAWSESGARPVFDGVSGISTGAIIAPFAFLGPGYDVAMEELYSSYRTKDIVEASVLSGLIVGAALGDTAPFHRLIAQRITADLMTAVAVEHRKGRVLLIGTTNLDSGRPVIWNMGAVAASGHPEALALFRSIILASASIPVAFPPVLIPVIGPDGAVYDEMHVDGGATSQITFISPSIPTGELAEKIGGHGVTRRLFIIVNNDLQPSYAPVPQRTLAIGRAAVSALIRGGGTGDLYKLYLIAARDGIEYNVAWIPPGLPCPPPAEEFDPALMRCVFAAGAANFRSGDFWRDLPPFFVPLSH